MKKRNPFLVFVLTLVTLGIYGIYWQVITKIEMNRVGANIPTAWLLLVPIVNIWWLYKYCMGVDHVTEGKMSGILAFLLLFILGVIGMAIVQDSLNKVADTPQQATSPTTGLPVSPAAATPSEQTQEPPVQPPAQPLA